MADTEVSRASGAAEGASFGAWLKEHRRAVGLTQKELGQHIGCSESALRKYESGARRPSRQIVERLADYFDLLPEQRQELTAAAGFGIARKLPARLTSLIGREKELAEALDFLLRKNIRLLTLTGPPGVGKTRLAIQVATEAIEPRTNGSRPAFPDGVFFVDLAPIRDPGLVLGTIAQTLGVRQLVEGQVLPDLVQELRMKRVLLLLDNFEQVTEASASIVSLLEECPQVKALVTSREVLRLRGEQQLLVPTLALPDLAQEYDAEKLLAYPSVMLFVERARALEPEFDLTNGTAGSIAAICVRLEGLPLAIELAAAHAGILSPAQMLDQLRSRFPLLTGGARDLPVRHQALHDSIGWSYDLLDSARQALFAYLSVFAGGFTLEGAEAVCNSEFLILNSELSRSEGEIKNSKLRIQDSVGGKSPNDTFESVKLLLEASMLQRIESTKGGVRFRMLETIREYAAERLEATGRGDELRKRHAGYYLKLAETADGELNSPEQARWLDKLEEEQENVREALDWLLAEREAETAARIAGALTRFWEMRGHWSVGRRWLEETLKQGGSLSTGVRAKAAFGAGRFASLQDDHERAGALFEEALALYREGGDKRGTAQALNGLALLAALRGKPDRARELLEESLGLSRALGDNRMSAATLSNLGQLAADVGEYDRSAALLGEAVIFFEELGDKWGVAVTLENMGQLNAEQGNYEQALSLLEESLARNIELGDKAHISWVCGDIGIVALAAGDASRSIDSTTKASELFHEMGDKRGQAGASFILGAGMLSIKHYAEAVRHFKGSIVSSREIGDDAGCAQGLDGLASVAAACNDPKLAARLLGAAQHVRDESGAGYRVRPIEQPLHEECSAAVNRALGVDAALLQYQEGYSLPTAQALSLALGFESM